jgi:hypothetical protein
MRAISYRGKIPSPEYQATPHSHNVEERERGQASTRTWSEYDHLGDEVGGPDREFRGELAADLMKKLGGGGGDGNGRVASTNPPCIDGLIRDSTTSLSGDNSSPWAREDCNEDGVLDNVGRQAGTPSWSWGKLGERRCE